MAAVSGGGWNPEVKAIVDWAREQLKWLNGEVEKLRREFQEWQRRGWISRTANWEYYLNPYLLVNIGYARDTLEQIIGIGEKYRKRYVKIEGKGVYFDVLGTLENYKRHAEHFLARVRRLLANPWNQEALHPRAKKTAAPKPRLPNPQYLVNMIKRYNTLAKYLEEKASKLPDYAEPLADFYENLAKALADVKPKIDELIETSEEEIRKTGWPLPDELVKRLDEKLEPLMNDLREIREMADKVAGLYARARLRVDKQADEELKQALKKMIGDVKDVASLVGAELPEGWEDEMLQLIGKVRAGASTTVKHIETARQGTGEEKKASQEGTGGQESRTSSGGTSETTGAGVKETSKRNSGVKASEEEVSEAGLELRGGVAIVNPRIRLHGKRLMVYFSPFKVSGDYVVDVRSEAGRTLEEEKGSIGEPTSILEVELREKPRRGSKLIFSMTGKVWLSDGKWYPMSVYMESIVEKGSLLSQLQSSLESISAYYSV